MRVRFGPSRKAVPERPVQSVVGRALVTEGITDLGTLGGSESFAFDVNDGGQVVGVSEIATGDRHAFLWQNGVMMDLGTLGGNRSEAYAINQSGQVVGMSTTTSRGGAAPSYGRMGA